MANTPQTLQPILPYAGTEPDEMWTPELQTLSLGKSQDAASWVLGATAGDTGQRTF